MKTLLLAFALLFSLSNFAQTADYFLLKAEESYMKGEPSGALRWLDKGLQKHPVSGPLNNAKLQVLMDLMKWEEAYQHTQFLQSKGVKSLHLYESIAIIQMERFKLDSAILFIDKAMELALDDTMKNNVMINKANIYTSFRDFEKSSEILSQCLQFDSTNHIVLASLSYVKDELGEYEEALKLVNASIEIFPHSPITHLNKGIVLQHLGQHEEALVYFNRAQEMAPEHPYPNSNKALSYCYLGEYKKALKLVNESIKQNGDNSYAYWVRAQIYIETNKKQKACTDLHKSIELKFTLNYGEEAQELLDKHCSN